MSNYPSKLSEELKRAQGIGDKIKVIEIAMNEALLKANEHWKELEARADEHGGHINDLIQEKDQFAAEIKMAKAQIDTLTAANNALAYRIEVLESKPARGERPAPTHMTPKAMASALGETKNHEVLQALKFLARKHARENGIEDQITKGDGEKSHEFFPMASAQWAMEQVKK